MEIFSILSSGADIAIIYLAARLLDISRRVNIAEKAVAQHSTDIAILQTKTKKRGI